MSLNPGNAEILLARPEPTFGDVNLLPGESSVDPNKVSTAVPFSERVNLYVPVWSAAMDTVTEYPLAIALAREGGVGIIHRNLSIEDQASQVERVKRSEAGIVRFPITVRPTDTIGQVKELMARHEITGFPVVWGDTDRLVGMLTNRDIRFVDDPDTQVQDRMKKRVITAPEGTTPNKARKIMDRKRLEKLPLVDEDGNLTGLITVKDILKQTDFPYSSKDELGRLLVGAAVGIDDEALERAGQLVDAGVDILVVDSSHGHHDDTLEMIKKTRSNFGDRALIVGGNVVTAKGALAVAGAGADVVKVGVGPGSICTTRVVTGVGRSQLPAVYDIARALESFKERRVHVVADGGIQNSGDIAKALAAGASSVMIGNLLARTFEAPGRKTRVDGVLLTDYQGMGSERAMAGRHANDRYHQDTDIDPSRLIAQGISGKVAIRGTVGEVVYQLVGGLRFGMGYIGAHSIEEMPAIASFQLETNAGNREGHVHDMDVITSAPNYEP